jgi:hypothetical protein
MDAMQSTPPNKEAMIAAMRQIHARDGHVSKRAIRDETEWDPEYYFDKFWPVVGYSGAPARKPESSAVPSSASRLIFA